MDPHQVQNNMNLGHGQQPPLMNVQGQSQSQSQYNQMLLQQQYMNMNNFPQFYGNNQMLSMDPFQQQQYLMMQQQQMPQMFQMPQQSQAPAIQQHLLQQQPQMQTSQVQSQSHAVQQQQQQRFAQHQHQQAHQALKTQQQRLLEEQQRQIEQRRIEEQRVIEQRRQEELARQRQKEAADRADELRRHTEMMQQREKEMQEMIRQQEEATRLAEEQRRREEAEQIEKEKLLRIRAEQLKKQQQSEKEQRDMMDRMNLVARPLSLVATHFMNKLTTLIPFPCENLSTSSLPCVCPTDRESLVDSEDPLLVEAIASALSKVNVKDIITHSDKIVHLESNDLPMSQMPSLIKAIMINNCNALDVDEGGHDMVLDTDITDMENVLTVPSTAGSKHATSKPSTITTDSVATTSTAVHEVPKVTIQLDAEAVKLRRQMASVGKQPKAGGGNQRRKRDQVENLYDSMTEFFEPSAPSGRRRRLRTRTGTDDDAADPADLELIAKMEAAEKLQQEHEGGSGREEDGLVTSDDENRFFDKKKRKKKEQREPEMERPPTPTEIIQQRELEWAERQRKRQEKERRRKAEQVDDASWNNSEMAENDSYTRFMSLTDGILDQVEGMDVMNNGRGENDEDEDENISQELLVERFTMDELRNETQKLKSWKKLNQVPVDRLVRLVSIMERNMSDVVSQDGSRLLVPVVLDEEGEEEDATLRELVGDRLVRAVDAACTALLIMTCHKMPKQVFIEDAIDRAINLCKQYLNHIIFPASDSMFRSNAGKKSKVEDGKRRRKPGTNSRNRTVQHMYARIGDLMNCFSSLVKIQLLSETSVHHLASMAIASFFVSNVGEIQLEAMNLATNIFSLHDDSIRVSMLNDMLNSLHRLPPGKNTNNSYRLEEQQWISNTTVLMLQLVQSVVKMPKRRRHEGEDDVNGSGFSPDAVVKESFRDSQRLANQFLAGFLAKCSCKGNKSEGEEDYRRLFEGFLQDLLVALYKPEWPAAEMILTILGTLLVKHYRTKATDIAIRQASLDYLGSITARLRRDTRSVNEDSEKRMEIIVKTLVFEEQEEQQWDTVDQVDISEMTRTDRLKKLEQALIDYLIDKKGDETGVEYAIRFYAGEWYKETAEDLDVAKAKFKADKQAEMTDKERRKLEKKYDRMTEKGASMKEFLIKLVDKKQLRKRKELTCRLGNVMLDADAAWAVKFLASRREFTHSFDIYLKHILFGVSVEGTVSLRTKAMRCLTQIIEADHEVLGMLEVRNAVNARMMDPNAAVREATIELLGKFLLVKEEFIPTYYNILLERIKDSGTAVRKRVIRIMREICEKYPSFENTADMLSKLVRRVVDEDGVKKLVQDTFAVLWFQPCPPDDGRGLLEKKVTQMTSVARICANEQTTDFLEQLLQALLKIGDKTVLIASRQIVDTLVDTLLTIERIMAADGGSVTDSADDLSSAQLQKNNQERLLACLTTLSMFSKVRPELMVRHAETLQPYLSMKVTSKEEMQVLNEVICMLERVVPLMNHPSDGFLQNVDTRLAQLTTTSGQLVVESAVSCAAAIWHRFPRTKTAFTANFLSFLRNLNLIKQKMETDSTFQLKADSVPLATRAVFTIGLLARYFDFDALLATDEEALKCLVLSPLPPNQVVEDSEMQQVAEEDKNPEARRYRDNVFSLLYFFTRNSNPLLQEKALVAIGHLCAQHADYLARLEVKNIYNVLLKGKENERVNLRIQALRNLEMFLLCEEKKMVKSNDDWEKGKEQQNLKEMELAGSGLGSAVIQMYWQPVLMCYFTSNETVRNVATQVTWLTLSQGLVTPGSSIPALIAMTTDPLPLVRNKVENLLKDIDTKYSGMVQSKAINGIRYAFQLQAKVRQGSGAPVRGIRACDTSATANNSRLARDPFGLPRMSNDGQALLSGLYSSLRGNRQQRRSFLNSVLRLFSEDSREKLSLQEWIFVADNLAMFPYQVLDEPLYAIRQIDGIISLSGQAIVSQFKENLQPPTHLKGLDDDALFEAETLFRCFPDDKRYLYEIMLNSQACFILLYLKNFLIKLYGFTDAKVQEYSPSEAAKVYDKAVARRNVHIFQPSTALEELRPEVIEERKTMDGHYKLAHKIGNFRKMLLSLDRLEDDDEDATDEAKAVTETMDDDEDIDGETDGEMANSETMSMSTAEE